jgi:Zn-finger nucleic acid-binding protein
MSRPDPNVSLQVCGNCHGIWMERAELNKKRAKLPLDLTAVSRERILECPRCLVSLTTYLGQLVEIDLCDRCGGLFLDAGELDLLVEARQLQQAKRGPAGVTFVCNTCRRERPIDEQVVGAQITLCSLCADRDKVKPDGAARRSAIDPQRRKQLKAQAKAQALAKAMDRDESEEPSGITASDVAEGASTVFEILIGVLEIFEAF